MLEKKKKKVIAIQRNSNGLSEIQDIDIITISKTHEINKSHLEIPKYNHYDIPHIAVREFSLKKRRKYIIHLRLIINAYQTEKIQSNIINITLKTYNIYMSLLYCSSRNTITRVGVQLL